MGAPDDFGIDGRHHEGAGPGFKVIVPGNPRLIRAIQSLLQARRVERVGVHDPFLDDRVFGSLFRDVHQARDGATTDAPCGAAHATSDMVGVVAEAFLKLFLQEINGQVRGDRIEAAAVHESRTTGFGDRVDLFVYLRHPLGFTREVAIMRTFRRAGFEHRRAVLRIRTNGADQRTGLVCHGAKAIRVSAVGDEYGQFREV